MVFMPNITTNHAITYTNFSGEKKYYEVFRGVHFLTIRRKTFQSNLVLVVVLGSLLTCVSD